MEFIWICGGCAAGKTTLIEKLLQPENESLRRRFGIVGSRVQALSMRLDADEPLDDFCLADADHVLIHWRYAIHDRILELWDDRPDCGHRIIVLWRPLDQVRRDLKRRNPDKDSSRYRIKLEWAKVKELMEQIDPARIPREIVDASAPDYPRLPGWP